jgi:hypothetical protein
LPGDLANGVEQCHSEDALAHVVEPNHQDPHGYRAETPPGDPCRRSVGLHQRHKRAGRPTPTPIAGWPRARPTGLASGRWRSLTTPIPLPRLPRRTQAAGAKRCRNRKLRSRKRPSRQAHHAIGQHRQAGIRSRMGTYQILPLFACNRTISLAAPSRPRCCSLGERK